jgi:hypothetical protein
MKKIFLGSVILLGAVVLSGCGKSMVDVNSSTIHRETTHQNEITPPVDYDITETEQQEVVSRLQEIKKEVLKIKMYKDFTPDEKTAKIKVLQVEIQELMKKGMGK